jgi:phospholipid/cholesterol/gamma-HCH transport system substrate-binding protein
MQYSNELKVGAAIVLAAVVAFAGVRFFQNVPLFGSSYVLYAEFDDAGGLTGGNPVRMKGVKVGSVDRVRLDPKTQTVRVRLQMQRGPVIPKGSQAQVSGISALGGVHVKITPGPRANAQLAPGSTLEAPAEGSSLDQLTAQAPALASKADSVLTGANATLAGLNRQLRNPDSDLRRTLASLRAMSGDLEQITEAEAETIRRLLRNLEGISGDLQAFTSENGDSLDVAVHRLNRSLTRLNRSLASFEKTSATLDTITTKLNSGQGTAGRLVNDPGLYTKLDSAAARTNRLLLDFQENPGRYLNDMTLVKVF